MNVALVLPLFYEYARNVRNGVLEWVDCHPGWRVIEMDPGEPVSAALEQNLHGAIIMPNTPRSNEAGSLFRHIPVVDCSLQESAASNSLEHANLTFDRMSLSRLAVRHFKELGLEVAGYVGCSTSRDGQLVPRVAGMRRVALEAGMEWVCYDTGDIDPSARPEWLWNGHKIESLVKFLHEAPKPLGILTQDDYFGVMVCEAAQREGISLPGEIAVLGQGNRVMGRGGELPLSSVNLPGREVGMEAAEVLDAWMKGVLPDPWRRLIPCTSLTIRRSTGGASLDLRIERAKRHLDRHALHGVTVQELADIATCSPKTLRAKFSEIYGMDISQTVRERRTETALRLLAETDLEISEIGKHCGFGAASNFFNFITRQTGGTGPADYRRQMREK